MVPIDKVIRFITGYSCRWEFESVDPTKEAFEWMNQESGATWSSHERSYHNIAHKFWANISPMTYLDKSVYIRAQVSLGFFSVLPNEA